MTQAAPAAWPHRERLPQTWELCAAAPAEFDGPAAAERAAPDRWFAVPDAATAAAGLRAVGRWSLDDAPRRFDAEDWWYRTEFSVEPGPAGSSAWLVFDGLAGVADAWLDDEPLLHSDNMYLAQAAEVAPGRHRLLLRFRSLDGLLEQRRPRPRWRAPLVAHQQLRWWRQTLLGRMPGWAPPAAPVGLWKDVFVERRIGGQAPALCLQARLLDDGTGELDVACVAPPLKDGAVERVVLELARGDARHAVDLAVDAAGSHAGRLRIAAVEPWWPHTHGEPALYAAQLLLWPQGRSEPLELALAPVGFRRLNVDTADGGFALAVNGVPVFCRGACWMPLDVTSLRASPQAYRDAVAQVRAAGMNMLRITGATVYEDAAFFEACDAAGVLVWQDLMFANMDYPEQDAAFLASVQAEVAQQLARWQAHPSLAVVCGNSEVEQQAAMWGASRELWSPPLFHATLRRQVEAALPDVPYWPSSAHGGAFPHQSDVGTSSYYGVGAYLRAVDDARRAAPRFATECLGFANVPEPETLARMPGGPGVLPHQPVWKARVPRDMGAGWDFDDVRDHYLERLFWVDAGRLRGIEPERYLALGRAASGEVMARTFAEWRRPGSRCAGALVWTLRDLWAGAGWGLVDDAGVPKACWFALKRVLQPVAVTLTDEGGNGLAAHVVNERARALHGELRIAAYAAGDAQIAAGVLPLALEPRSAASFALVQALEGFVDLSYAYRFGPPPATVVHVRLLADDGAELGEAFHFPAGMGVLRRDDPGLEASWGARDDGHAELRLACRGFAQSVHLQLDGHAFDDNHFHMAPGSERRVIARRLAAARPSFRGEASVLNSDRRLALRREA